MLAEGDIFITRIGFECGNSLKINPGSLVLCNINIIIC